MQGHECLWQARPASVKRREVLSYATPATARSAQLEAHSGGEAERKYDLQRGVFKAGALAHRLLDQPGSVVWEEIGVMIG